MSKLTGWRAARSTAAERADWVGRWERSGQSVAAFCRETGLSPHCLGRWRRQMGGVERSSESAPQFHTVPLPGPASSDWGSEVELSGGMKVRFRCGVPGAWVRELVEALR